MKNKNTAYIQMHIAVFLWGVTAILGKLISLDQFFLVGYRMFIVSIVLLFFPVVIKNLRKISVKNFITTGSIGFIIALHWLLFYGSIKKSNASIALVAMSLTSFFTAIIEPIILGTVFNKKDILIGIIIIPAIILISQNINTNYIFGFILGIGAAFLAAIFTILNKKYTQSIESNTITFLQMLFGFVFLCLALPFYIQFYEISFAIPTSKDWLLLLVLAIGCTILPYYLYLIALKKTNAYTTNLINNLEPIYGIILSVIILHENQEINWQFYVGTTIIFLSVFMYPILEKYNSKYST